MRRFVEYKSFSVAMLSLTLVIIKSMFGYTKGTLDQFVSVESSPMSGRQRTKSPIVTGSSVLGIKYKDGIMLAADTLASYGSLARYKDIERIKAVGKQTLIGASGEYSDYQRIMQILEDQYIDDMNVDDGFQRSPREIHSYLRAVMYNRRNKMNPLWNYLIVAGVSQKGSAFLGCVDHIGTAFEEDYIATGFGGYLAIPIIRKKWRADMSEGEARALLEDCLKVLFYRDARSCNRIQIAKATADGVLISEPYELDTNWDIGASPQVS